MKLNSLYALCFVLALVSCSKDDEKPTFKQEDLVGSWVRTSTTIDAESTCADEELTITTTVLTVTCIEDGFPTDSDAEYTYASNTASFETFGIAQQMVVTSLNATTLKVDWKLEGQKYGSSVYEKQ